MSLLRGVVDMLPARVRRSTLVALALHVAEFRRTDAPALTTQEYEWLISEDTGISSLTIFTVMTGRDVVRNFSKAAPRDFWDFGRCYRLLQRFPHWQARLAEVGAVCPEWAPIAGDWDRLVSFYEADQRDILYLELHRHLDSPAGRVGRS